MNSPSLREDWHYPIGKLQFATKGKTSRKCNAGPICDSEGRSATAKGMGPIGTKSEKQLRFAASEQLDTAKKRSWS
jgi:hypothetical protein